MLISKIGQRRQVTIPKAIFDEMKLKGGEYFEVCCLNDEELLLRKKKIVDVPKEMNRGELPEVLPYEERMKLLQAMEGEATDDSEDIDTEFIKKSRTSKKLTISFDE